MCLHLFNLFALHSAVMFNLIPIICRLDRKEKLYFSNNRTVKMYENEPASQQNFKGQLEITVTYAMTTHIQTFVVELSVIYFQSQFP